MTDPLSKPLDAVVIGGGVLGTSVAIGLLREGLSTAILDEGDVARRASRGNFALVWVQSKGMGMPAYSSWTRRSARLWPGFAEWLQALTGVDVALQQPGGFTLCLSEAEMEKREAMMRRLCEQPGFEPMEWEMWDRARVRQALPEIGPEVVGASYTPYDGHLNSLRLFRALHTGFERLGGHYRANHAVERITPRPGGGFVIEAGGRRIETARVILAAGVGNARLAPMVGLEAPVRPQRGQVLVTEKTAPFLNYPVVTLRQTDEGGVMIGDSAEELTDDREQTLGILGTMADRAVRMFPRIGTLNVVRTWSALRVMTKDGFPIYNHSETAPGAWLATCHSGVTLAATHAEVLAPMIAAGEIDPALAPFSARRFHVSASA